METDLRVEDWIKFVHIYFFTYKLKETDSVNANTQAQFVIFHMVTIVFPLPLPFVSRWETQSSKKWVSHHGRF